MVRNYHVSTLQIAGMTGHARLFNIRNFVGGSEELERRLNDQLKVPPEVEAYYRDILSWENEIQFAEDIATRAQELEDSLYIPDLAVDEYLDNLVQWGADLEFLGESECDP